jgi:hypothetical protein
MRPVRVAMLSMMVLLCSWFSPAQQSVATATNTVVPPLVNFSGVLTDVNGKPLTGAVGVTFSLYQEQQGGSPLWLETQNVKPNSAGRYTVMLGSATSQGIPTNLFASGEARWLSVQVQGQAEQPRVLLVAVPYALKALDAQTLGGKPASAFQAASSIASGNVNSATITGTGKKDYVPLWLGTTKLGSSNLFQSTAGNLGIATTTPAANLDVNGTSDIRNTLTLFPSGSAPTLSVNGTAFAVSNKGLVSFVSGQTFPGTGTITGVTAGTDLTGGGNSGAVTLNVDTTKVPQLAANNTFTGTQTINNLTTITGTSGSGVLQVTNTGTTGANPAIVGTTNSTGASGVKGVASATSGVVNGVLGTTSSTSGYGVQGQGPFVGVLGQASGSSGNTTNGLKVGVWGDTAAGSAAGYAVLGTANDTYGGYFYNNGQSAEALYADNSSGAGEALIFTTSGADGMCSINGFGNLFCAGAKSAVVPVDGGSRNVALYAIEGPEHWFEDAGSSQLYNGVAVVNLEQVFGQTVNTEIEYHVFLTPNGDCKGLYVSQKGPTSFEVRELGGGTSSIAFDYRIMAKRKGYESVRLADKTSQFGKEAIERRKARRPVRPSAPPSASVAQPVSAESIASPR